MRTIPVHELRQELQRVLQSRYFARAHKRRRFLEFVCEQTLRGDADKISEYVIGMEVYGRGDDFDPHEDSIVRVQAHELRKTLAEYYQHEGQTNPIRVELPAGHYVPVFSRTDNGQQGEPLGEAAGSDRPGRARAAWIVAGCLAVCCAVLGVILIREQAGQSPDPAVHWPTAYSAGMEWFWGPFLPPADPPLIVIPVHPILRAAHRGDSDELRNRGYEIPKGNLPEFRGTIHWEEMPAFRFVPSLTDFTAVGEALGLLRFFEILASARQTVRLKPARLTDFSEIESGNVILLGGNQIWSGRAFVHQDGFRLREGVITNERPRDGEREVYRPEFDPVTGHLRKDYALILMLPNQRRQHRVLLVYGIYTQGSQAAIEFITVSSGLDELRRALTLESPGAAAPPEYFQVLLETTVENWVPGKTTVVGVRAISPESAS